jgi:hypothetical protein
MPVMCDCDGEDLQEKPRHHQAHTEKRFQS